MIEVTLPDGSVRQFPDGTTEEQVTASLSAPPPLIPGTRLPPPETPPGWLETFGKAAYAPIASLVPDNLVAITRLGYEASPVALASKFFLPGDPVRAAMAPALTGLEQWARDSRVDVPQDGPWSARMAGGVVGSLGTLLATAPLKQFQIPALAMAAFTPEYLEAKDRGASENRALAQGTVSGLAEALWERLSPFHSLRVAPTVGRIATEAAEEVGTQATTDLSAAYLTQTDPSRGLSKEFFGRLFEAGVQGAGGAGALAPIISHSRRQLRNQYAEQEDEIQSALAMRPEDAGLKRALAEVRFQQEQLADKPLPQFEHADVTYSDSPKWSFTPLRVTDTGTLQGYGVEVGRKGADAVVPGPVPQDESFLQALRSAGFETLNGKPFEANPTRSNAQAFVGARYTREGRDLDLGEILQAGDIRTEDGKPVGPDEIGKPVKGRVEVFGVPSGRLEEELREENAHLLLNRTAAGRAILDEFQRKRKLTAAEREALDAYQGANERHLADEFLAKLTRKGGWAGTLVARVKNALGLDLTNAQAGRLLLRNLKATGGTTTAKVGGTRESLTNLARSKVRNPDGSLKVLYHGTADKDAIAKGISVFRTAHKYEPGLHLGSSDQAEQFARSADLKRHGQIYPVYANITNPLRTPDMWPLMSGWKANARVLDELQSVPLPARRVLEMGLEGLYDGKELMAELSKLGYDGIVYDNRAEGGGDSWIAFRPEQIKSAIGNKGTYDITNPDIRESRVSLAAFDKSFKSGEWTNPIGLPARTPQERSAIAALFRNPRYEVYRVVFLKEGTVVGIANTTVRLPHAVNQLPGSGVGSIAVVVARAKELGADSVFDTHNHPSGDSTPSDRDLTSIPMVRHDIEQFGLRYLGHVITNHDTHSLISGDPLKMYERVKLEKPDEPFPALSSEPVDSTERIVEEATKVGSGKLPLLLFSLRGQLRGVEELPAGVSAETAEALVRRTQSELGALDVHAYVSSEEGTGHAVLRHLQERGSVGTIVVGGTEGGWGSVRSDGYLSSPSLRPRGVRAEVDEVFDREQPLRFSRVRVAGTVYTPDALPIGAEGETVLQSGGKWMSYDEAVAAGDMELAQRFVDEAARKAGYTIGPVWHGTRDATLTAFDPETKGGANDAGFLGTGTYFSSDRGVASYYGGSGFGPTTQELKSGPFESNSRGGGLGRFFLRGPLLRVPFTKPGAPTEKFALVAEALGTEVPVQFKRDFRVGARGSREGANWLAAQLRARGWGGVYMPFEGGFDELMVLDSAQAKSADPVTYDDAGNVIPLARRFNRASDDIRESVSKARVNDLAYQYEAKAEIRDQPQDMVVENGVIYLSPTAKDPRSLVLLGLAEQNILPLDNADLKAHLQAFAGTEDVRTFLTFHLRPWMQRSMVRRVWDRLRFFLPSARAEKAFWSAIESRLEAAPFKLKFDARDPVQVEVDKNARLIQEIGPEVQRLRDAAGVLEELRFRAQRLRETRARFERVRDEAVNRGETVPAIGTEAFTKWLSKDQDLHEAFLEAQEANSVANKLARIRELNERLQMAAPAGAAPIAQELRRATLEELASIKLPDDTRAGEELLAQRDRIPEAKAAKAALAALPAEWTELFDLARGGPYVPNPAHLPKSTVDAAESDFLFQRAILQDQWEELEASVGKKLRGTVAKLRKAILAKAKESAEAQIAAEELVIAAAEDAPDELTGGIYNRDVADRIKSVRAQAVLFAQNLPPGTSVEQLRDFAPQDLDVLATQVNLTPDVLREVLALLGQSPALLNAVTRIREANRANPDLTTLLDQTETGKPNIAAIRKLRKAAKRLDREVVALERELAAVEVELETVERLGSMFTPSALHDQIVAKLEAGEDVTALRAQRQQPDGVVRLVFPLDNGQGWRFGAAPGVNGLSLSTTESYTKASIEKVATWIEQAKTAVVDLPTRRGLDVGIRIAENFLNERFAAEELAKTLLPSNFFESIAKSRFGVKQWIPMLVPGLWGQQIAKALTAVTTVQQKRNAIEARVSGRMHKLLVSAARSMGYKLSRLRDVQEFRRARDEVAHRLRRHGSGVEPGVRLWSVNKPITAELIALIAFDRSVGRMAQALDLSRPYGGIRVNYPGKQVVRPPAETGDLGLARLADRSIYEAFAVIYESGDLARIKAWWNSADSKGGLASHVFDSDRADIHSRKFKAQMVAARNAVESRRFPQPDTVDGWAALIGITPEELLSDLDQYGKRATERVAQVAQTVPSDKTGLFESEGDANEFTTPAAKMAFPGAWYHYGSSSGLKGFLNRTTDAINLEYLQAVHNAEKALTHAASKAVLGPEADAEVKWVLGITKTPTDAQRGDAAKLLKERAEFLRAHRNAALVSRDLQRQNAALRWLNRFGVGPMLATPIALSQNVLSVITSSYLALTATYGPVGAAVLLPANLGLTLLNTAFSLATFVTGKDTAADQFLQTEGIFNTWPKRLSAEREAVERGEPTTAWTRAGLGADEGIRKISAAIGTIRGDQLNNLFAVRVLLPQVVLLFKAQKWAGRAPTPAQVELLATLGLTADQVADLPVFRSYATEAGAALARRIAADYNASTVANRPESNQWFSLLGWTSFTVGSAASLFRRTPEQTRLRFGREALFIAVVAGLSNLVRLGGLETTKEGMVLLAQRLLDAIDDEEDDWQILAAVAGLLRAAIGVLSTSPKQSPLDPGYFDRPVFEVATDLAQNIPQGLGLNEFTLPVLSIGKGFVSGAVQMARGYETGEADVRAGARHMAGVAGLYGRILAEALIPGGRAGFEATADLTRAAHRAGVPTAPYLGMQQFLSATPFRREMLALGERLVAGEDVQPQLEALRANIETRAANRAIARGTDPQEAARAALNATITAMDPYRMAVGRSITPEEKAKLGTSPAVQRQEAARDAVIKALKVRATAGMRSPIRRPKAFRSTVPRAKRVRL